MAGSDDSQASDAGGVNGSDDFAELERLLREAPESRFGKQSFDEWIDERAQKENDQEAHGADSDD